MRRKLLPRSAVVAKILQTLYNRVNYPDDVGPTVVRRAVRRKDDYHIMAVRKKAKRRKKAVKSAAIKKVVRKAARRKVAKKAIRRKVAKKAVRKAVRRKVAKKAVRKAVRRKKASRRKKA
jgi:hypothetical protein